MTPLPSSSTSGSPQPTAGDGLAPLPPPGVATVVVEPHMPCPGAVGGAEAGAVALAQRSVAVPGREPPPLPGLPSGMTAELQAAFLSEDHDQIAGSLDKAMRRYGRQAVVSHRMDCDFDVWKKITYKQASLFFLACRSASLDSVKLLSAGGSDCLEETPECSIGTPGRTPLIMAVQKGKSDLVGYLLELGANIDAVDAQGHTLELFNVIFNARRPVEYKAICQLLAQHRQHRDSKAPTLAENIYGQTENGQQIKHTLYVRGLSIALDSWLAVDLAELVLVIRDIENADRAAGEGKRSLLEKTILILRYAAISPELGQLLANLYKDLRGAIEQGAGGAAKESEKISLNEMLEALNRAAWAHIQQQKKAVADAEEAARAVRETARAQGTDKTEQRNAVRAAERAVFREQEKEQQLKEAVAELEGDSFWQWFASQAAPA